MKFQGQTLFEPWILCVLFTFLGVINPVLANENQNCTLHLQTKSVAKLDISLNGTVLNFPAKPSKVILGRKGSFGIEYVDSDLAISPLSAEAKSNLFVYLDGRRFNFNLIVNTSGGCTLVSVRDSAEVQMQAKDER